MSKIPSITFFLPPNNASGPPACRLLKGGSLESRYLHNASGRELVDHHLNEADLGRREALVGEEAGEGALRPRRDPFLPCSERNGPARLLATSQEARSRTRISPAPGVTRNTFVFLSFRFAPKDAPSGTRRTPSSPAGARSVARSIRLPLRASLLGCTFVAGT